MRNFLDIFETHKRLFISAFSMCMTIPSSDHHLIYSVMNTTFKSEEPKKIIYWDYSKFSFECFEDVFHSVKIVERADLLGVKIQRGKWRSKKERH